MTFIKKQFVPLVNSDALSGFEADLGYLLPATYRDFLLKYNGGEPLNPTVSSSGDFYGDSSIRYFFSISEDSRFSIAYKYAIYSGSGRISKEMLPIGGDVGGNLILLALAGAEVGKVFFWDHDIEGLVDDPESVRHLRLIGNSFEEFCRGLQAAS